MTYITLIVIKMKFRYI